MGKANGFTIEDFVARSGASNDSIAQYRYHLTLMERRLGKPLIRASERDLVNLMKGLRQQKSGPHFARLLSMFYKSAGRADRVAVCKLKQRVRKLRAEEILTVADVQRLVEACDSSRDRALIGCLWDTGVRISELLALDLGNVRETAATNGNGSRTVFHLSFHKVKVPGEEHIGYVIESAPILSAWLKAHPDKRPDAPLFPAYTGTRWSRKAAHFAVRQAARKAGMAKHVHPHLFRHSRATFLLANGMSEANVKNLLGWAPGSIMLSRYSHLTNRDAYAALLRSEGYDVPEALDLGRLTFDEDKLRPVVPMVPPPGTVQTITPQELVGLLADPNVQRFLRLLEAARAPPPA